MNDVFTHANEADVIEQTLVVDWDDDDQYPRAESGSFAA